MAFLKFHQQIGDVFIYVTSAGIIISTADVGSRGGVIDDFSYWDFIEDFCAECHFCVNTSVPPGRMEQWRVFFLVSNRVCRLLQDNQSTKQAPLGFNWVFLIFMATIKVTRLIKQEATDGNGEVLIAARGGW